MPLELEDEIERREDGGRIISDCGEAEAEEPIRMLYGEDARDARAPVSFCITSADHTKNSQDMPVVSNRDHVFDTLLIKDV